MPRLKSHFMTILYYRLTTAVLSWQFYCKLHQVNILTANYILKLHTRDILLAKKQTIVIVSISFDIEFMQLLTLLLTWII